MMSCTVVYLCLSLAFMSSGATPEGCQGSACQWQVALNTLEERFTGIIDDLRFEMHTLQEANDDLYVKIARLESARPNSTHVRTPPVSFRVAIGGDLTVRHPDVVKFHTIQENNGAGYDASSGKFTCPVSGLYNFAVHLMSNTNYLEFAMSKGAVYQLHLLLQPVEARWYSDSGSITTSCARGEEVFIRVHWGPGAHTVLHGPWNFFSGHLVRAD